MARKCKNRKNHNCSPCPYCDAVEHEWDRFGEYCLNCGNVTNDYTDYADFDTSRHNGRVIRKHIEDD